ncbi:MAG: arsenite methyltransferase [Flavobacteriales bacterium]|nr:arsenite methyltransferase [Flavobacteriales bacterium]
MNTPEAIKDEVRTKYAAIARQDKTTNASSCCGSGGCSTEVATIMSEDYAALSGYNADADLGLGCGLPTQHAGIKSGDTVLDLGSGAGNDCFVARAAVGDDGRVIGVDFTPEMVEKAKANALKLGFQNVEFRQGDIEALPIGGNMIDVVVSNCVLNLVPDKRKAFSEVLRVLKPGGHFSISDVVLVGELPEALQQEASMYAGCISGALQMSAYLGLIHELGFEQVTVQKRKPITVPDDILENYLAPEELARFRSGGAGIFSITVTAMKGDAPCCVPDAEGKDKVKVATGEPCGCGADNACC